VGNILFFDFLGENTEGPLFAKISAGDRVVSSQNILQIKNYHVSIHILMG
jgi:hypothetical protein